MAILLSQVKYLGFLLGSVKSADLYLRELGEERGTGLPITVGKRNHQEGTVCVRKLPSFQGA